MSSNTNAGNCKYSDEIYILKGGPYKDSMRQKKKKNVKQLNMP